MTFDFDTSELAQTAARRVTPHDNCIVTELSSGAFPRYIKVQLPDDDGPQQVALWDGSLDLEVNDEVYCHEYAEIPQWRIMAMGGNDSGAGKVRVSKVWESDFGAVALQSDAAGNIGIPTATPGAKLEIEATTTSDIGLIVQTTDDNTGNNLIEYRDSAETLLVKYNAKGIYTQTNDSPSSGALVYNVNSEDSDVHFRIQRIRSGARNELIFINSASGTGSPSFRLYAIGAGVDLKRFNLLTDPATGRTTLGTINDAQNQSRRVLWVKGFADGGVVLLDNAVASEIPLTIQAQTAQSANTTEWQDSGGSVFATIGVGEDAATNTITDNFILGHQSTSTPAADFGVGQLFQLESSTTENQDAARIAALWTTATHGTRASALVFETLTGGGSLTEQMRIDGAGNVGIGTASPIRKLHVAHPGNQAILIDRTDTINNVNNNVGRLEWQGFNTTSSIIARIRGASDDSWDATQKPSRMTFETVPAGSLTPTERMRIRNNGDVGIGTTSPTAQLHIDQASTTAAQPVLLLDQADISEQMRQFETTIGVGNAIEAAGSKLLTVTHFVKDTLPGGLTRYTPYGTISTTGPKFTKNETVTTQGLGANPDVFAFGFYEFSAADANLTQASTTQTFGTANISYAVHAFAVTGGAGSVDAGVVGLRVNGTSIDDQGTRTTSDTETIIADITAAALDDYQETSKKWLGQVTYELFTVSGSPTTFSLDFNYGRAKYDDWFNTDFTITDIEAVGFAGANDAAFDIKLMHHQSSGWTYSAAAFTPITAANTVASLVTDHSTDDQLASSQHFAWKRDNLSEAINGANDEGFLIFISSSANNAIEYLNLHIGVIF